MNNVELLSPVGEWDSLVAAVQNGANAVYFGANEFNARMNSKNFDREELKKAIEYAKLRNVRTNLTLNILIKNNEFEKALELVKYAYECGIDALIVQDLGLANEIIKRFPDLDVHASTQMTIHNLEGVKEAQKLGFKRCVLARELSIEEIKNICKNSEIEIEVFIHGALCICYSGQCLMSSIIGGRSGNRGKCAGSCRLPYTLLKDGMQVDKGYLLSSKDVCTLDILPELIEAGAKSFKIEGRMKSPEYVGLVTSIYRKYIDLANSNKPYVVDEEDREKLMQIFNRGGFSTGFIKGKLGKEMMYKYKPNHLGIYVGKVLNYNRNKGYVKFKAEKEVHLGDSIAINDSSCKTSELMLGNTNIKTARIGQIVTYGRINGDIKPGDKIYRTVDINLNKEVEQISNKENIKRNINCKITLKAEEPVKLYMQDELTQISVEETGVVAKIAENNGISKERIEEQLSKLGNTVFKLENLKIELEDKIIIPISSLNEIRRNATENLETKLKESFRRSGTFLGQSLKCSEIKKCDGVEVSLCLNNINENLNYCDIKDVDNVYIPLRFFVQEKLKKSIKDITNKFNTYILMPAIYKGNYAKIDINKILSEYKIKGAVVSNLSQVELFKGLEKIANYTFNIANDYSIETLKAYGISKYIASPEFEKEAVQNLENSITKEAIVYGRILLMTTEYCAIGTYYNCKAPCQNGVYKLKDRMNFEFPIVTDRINCNNLIYNSKVTSIEWKELNIDSIRIDILDETIEEINKIIETHKNGNRLEGKDYTNGNINKEAV